MYKSSEHGHLLFLVMTRIISVLPEHTWEHTNKEGRRPLPIKLAWDGEGKDSSKVFSGLEE